MTTVLKIAGFALAVFGAVVNLGFFFTSDTDRYPIWMLLPVFASLILLIIVIGRRREQQGDSS